LAQNIVPTMHKKSYVCIEKIMYMKLLRAHIL